MADTEKLARLSHREMLVMKYLINGLSNKEIAETLSLSEKTISTYKTRLYTKLNVSNLLELADVASRYEKT
nr:LuxR C-terminal-related transcriptional regulator [Rahnella bonaserana]